MQPQWSGQCQRQKRKYRQNYWWHFRGDKITSSLWWVVAEMKMAVALPPVKMSKKLASFGWCAVWPLCSFMCAHFSSMLPVSVQLWKLYDSLLFFILIFFYFNPIYCHNLLHKKTIKSSNCQNCFTGIFFSK